MSDFNRETVSTLARLCRLDLSEEEERLCFDEMTRVVDYVHLLDEVDVSDISPYSHFIEQSIDSLREDEIKETLTREEFLANAPDVVGGMIRVPSVMKQEN
jgi:aspartyl-tRNA(Asn)/glutamyl-tRNA(Gln) amidotransferase subunit C